MSFSTTKDSITATTTTVSCDGNGPAIGHPKIYLTFRHGQKKLACPYCSQNFELAANASSSAVH